MTLKPEFVVDFDANHEEPWRARIKANGAIIPRVFRAVDEIAAIRRAWTWYDRNPHMWDEANFSRPATRTVDGETQAVPHDGGKVHGLVGKVWVFNRDTGDRRRISPEQLNEFIGNGYLKGGPRSK